MLITSDLAGLLCMCIPAGPFRIVARVGMFCMTWWWGATNTDSGPVPSMDESFNSWDTVVGDGLPAMIKPGPDQWLENWSPIAIGCLAAISVLLRLRQH